MATNLIPLPTPDEPAVNRVVNLGGTDYTLRFDWVERMGRWSLGIATAGNTPIVEGLALVAGYDFLACTAASNKPEGSLFLIADDTPTLETLQDAELFHITDD